MSPNEMSSTTTSGVEFRDFLYNRAAVRHRGRNHEVFPQHLYDIFQNCRGIIGD